MNGIVTCELSTKGRRETTLPLAILSIALQTRPPEQLLIYDDNDEPMNLTAWDHEKNCRDPLWDYMLNLLKEKRIATSVIPGFKRGQHWNHEHAQTIAAGDLIWRMDDDTIAEPTCLEYLRRHFDEKHEDPNNRSGHSGPEKQIGAVAPCVLFKNPGHKDIPADYGEKMDNAQWHYFEGVKEAEHLYSIFLYRKGITHYELALSKAAHREETIFSMKLRKAGYKLLIEPKAICRHFRFPTGGIRSPGYKKEMFDHDEKIFQEIYQEIKTDTKIVHLNCGLGDHIVFKGILPELRKRYSKFRVACCYPEALKDEPDCELMSIAEGNKITDPDRHHVYKRMGELKWDKPLADAFRLIYL